MMSTLGYRSGGVVHQPHGAHAQHEGVAGVGELQVHLRNLRNRPVYAVNTDQDSLYPSAALAPVAQALAAIGAPFTWREIQGYAHDPSYLPSERAVILDWVSKHPRAPHPERVTWEGTADAPGRRVDWLAVVRVEARG